MATEHKQLRNLRKEYAILAKKQPEGRMSRDMDRLGSMFYITGCDYRTATWKGDRIIAMRCDHILCPPVTNNFSCDIAHCPI